VPRQRLCAGLGVPVRPGDVVFGERGPNAFPHCPKARLSIVEAVGVAALIGPAGLPLTEQLHTHYGPPDTSLVRLIRPMDMPHQITW